MEKPLVSVIVAVKNGEAFIASAIKSVQEQDYRPLEIIVVDGQSEDGTAAIAQSFKDVRYFFQHNRGIADAYNVGLAAAQGEFVAFLSHDDMWLPEVIAAGRLPAPVPTVQYTIGMIRFFLEPGHETPRGFRRELFQGLHVGRIMETLLARRSLFDVIGDFDSTMALAEDVDWYARASDRAIPMAVIPEILLLQKRVHSRNASSDAQTSNRELLKALKRSIDRKRA